MCGERRVRVHVVPDPSRRVDSTGRQPNAARSRRLRCWRRGRRRGRRRWQRERANVEALPLRHGAPLARVEFEAATLEYWIPVSSSRERDAPTPRVPTPIEAAEGANERVGRSHGRVRAGPALGASVRPDNVKTCLPRVERRIGTEHGAVWVLHVLHLAREQRHDLLCARVERIHLRTRVDKVSIRDWQAAGHTPVDGAGVARLVPDADLKLPRDKGGESGVANVEGGGGREAVGDDGAGVGHVVRAVAALDIREDYLSRVGRRARQRRRRRRRRRRRGRR